MQRIRRDAGIRRVARSSPIRAAAWRRARSIPGPSRATRPAAGCCSSAPGASTPIPPSRGTSSRPAVRRELLYGRKGRYVGIFPFLKDLEEKRYKQYIRVFLRQYQLAKTCAECGGSRLNQDALAVRIGPDTIAGRVRSLDRWRQRVARGALAQLVREPRSPTWCWRSSRDRLEFLRDVGLGYLTLDRQTRTLSGGEAQRISLANALGSRLGGHALRARRALGRPPSPGHRPPARPASPAARRRQYRRGRGARPRRHPAGRLHAGAGPGRRRARRTGGARRARRDRDAIAHRPVPHRPEADRACRACGGWPVRRGSRSAAPACTTCVG